MFEVVQCNQLRKPYCPIFCCRLVDSRDIVELKMKQYDIELTIRKKEAMPELQPAPQPAVVYSSLPPAATPPPAAPTSTPTTNLARPTATPTSSPAPKSTKSSLPPLKSPMAGTFYRSPAPAEPPFVKVILFYLLYNLIFSYHAFLHPDARCSFFRLETKSRRGKLYASSRQ